MYYYAKGVLKHLGNSEFGSENQPVVWSMGMARKYSYMRAGVWSRGDLNTEILRVAVCLNFEPPRWAFGSFNRLSVHSLLSIHKGEKSQLYYS